MADDAGCGTERNHWALLVGALLAGLLANAWPPLRYVAALLLFLFLVALFNRHVPRWSGRLP